MHIKDVMTPSVRYMSPDVTLREAANVMKEGGFGSVPIAEGDKLIGIVTDRDIAVRAVAEGKDTATTKVREIMTPDILYCREDQDIEEVAQNMGENRFRRLPVINQQKRLVGIVSLGDLSTSGEPDVVGKSLEQISRR